MNEDGADIWRRQANDIATDPRPWAFQAATLLGGATACSERYFAAAETLRAGNEPSSDLMLLVPAQFLAAAAVELLLKAVALRRRPELATTGQKPFYTRKLAEIAGQFTGIAFSDSELRLLDRLGTTIEWAGRYPIPRWDSEKQRTKYDVPTHIVDGNVVINAREIPNSVSEESWRETSLLIDRLRTAYRHSEVGGM